MLDQGRVDYAKRNRFGGNALIPACERGHLETVRLLLARSKIDVDHVNNLGWTALLEAVFLGNGGERHQEIIRLLLQHGASVNLPTGTARRRFGMRKSTAMRPSPDFGGGGRKVVAAGWPSAIWRPGPYIS